MKECDYRSVALASIRSFAVVHAVVTHMYWFSILRFHEYRPAKKRKALKCKPSAHAQLLAHGAWLGAIIIMAGRPWPMGTGAIINTHAHR